MSLSGAVSKEIYFNASRAERRRTLKELRKLTGTPEESAHLRRVVGPFRPPLTLMACSECGNLTSRCDCTDAEGKPLDWSVQP